MDMLARIQRAVPVLRVSPCRRARGLAGWALHAVRIETDGAGWTITDKSGARCWYRAQTIEDILTEAERGQ